MTQHSTPGAYDRRNETGGSLGSLTRQLRHSSGGQGGSVVLIGLPGSGKTTQARILAERFGLHMISTGEMVRDIAREEGERGAQFRRFVDSGELVPDQLMFPLFREAAQRHPDGLILDGYPRTLVQASGLSSVVPTIRRVVLLDLPIPLAMGRLLARERSDDTPEIIVRRMILFTEETAPVATHYNTRKLLSSVDASGSIDEVTERIVECTGLRVPTEERSGGDQ